MPLLLDPARRRALKPRHRRAPVSAALQRAARQLARRRGVVGVFLGVGKTGDRWHGERSLVVHVQRKLHENHLSKAELLPKRVGRLRVDVIEVGAPRPHALDVSDQFAAPGPTVRTGTFTSLLPTADGAVAILSGHVCLPVVNGKITSRYDSTQQPPFELRSVDPASGQLFKGKLLRAAMTPTADWAVALFPDAVGDELDPTHPGSGDVPPLPVRADDLVETEPVRHFSRLSGTRVRGFFVHRALTPVPFRFEDGVQRSYSGALVVRGHGGPFSRGGDSGSLVFDGSSEAVGIILGGSEDGSLSYLLPVAGLRGPLGSHFHEVFR